MLTYIHTWVSISRMMQNGITILTEFTKKTCERLKLLRMLKYQVSRKALINIYFSFIRPVLEYADIVWDNCTLYESNLLESVQVEAGRIITGLRVNSSKSKMYEELGWEPLYKRREKHRLILLDKLVNRLSPVYLIQPYIFNMITTSVDRSILIQAFTYI